MAVQDSDWQLVPRVREGKRVLAPTWRAISWSSEMVFLKPAKPGRGAPVSQVSSLACPLLPLEFGCDRPENTVKSSR